MSKIPIHSLLESLGIRDLEAKTPAELKAIAGKLDVLIAEAKAEEKTKTAATDEDAEMLAAYQKLYRE